MTAAAAEAAFLLCLCLIELRVKPPAVLRLKRFPVRFRSLGVVLNLVLRCILCLFSVAWWMLASGLGNSLVYVQAEVSFFLFAPQNVLFLLKRIFSPLMNRFNVIMRFTAVFWSMKSGCVSMKPANLSVETIWTKCTWLYFWQTFKYLSLSRFVYI